MLYCAVFNGSNFSRGKNLMKKFEARGYAQLILKTPSNSLLNILVTLNSKLMIKTVSSSFRVCNLIMFINTYLIMFLLVFPPMFVFVFPHSKMGRLGIEFLPLNWKSRHVSNLFPFSYCELMEISFHTLSPIYI